MSKKLITACMALFALAAFALPAGASATELTHPTGTTLATGTKITGTSIGSLVLWNEAKTSKLVECSTATLTGTLTANDPTPKGTIETAVFGGTGSKVEGAPEPECTGTFGNVTVDTNIGNGTPWCLTLTSETAFSVRGNECAKEQRAITFVLTSTTVGTCKYSRTAAVTGTATTDTGVSATDAILHVPATVESSNATFTKEEGSILCPSTGLLEMSFTLETDNIKAEPLYIS